MNRQPRARIMKAKALTAPEPEFVSQVRAGANQEPLRAVKMDTGISDVLALFETKELTMKEAVKKAQQAGHDIAQLVFKGGDFSDRASVDAWLKEGGYSDGYEVTEKKDGDATQYTVTSTVLKFRSGSMRKVKGQADGLFVYVGEVEGEVVAEKTAEEVAASEAEAKPSAITSAKGDKDEANAASTETATAAKTEEAAATTEAATTEGDGGAKVIDPKDITTEGVTTITSVLAAAKADAEASVKKEEPAVAAEDAVAATVAKADGMVAEIRQKAMYDVSRLGSVLSDLRWMVADAEYSDLPEDAVTSIKGAAMQLLDALVSAGNQAVSAYVEAFKTDVSKTDATETKTEAVVTAKSEEIVTPAATMDPALAEILKGMAETVATLATAVKSAVEDIAEVKSSTAKADEIASNKGQSRKGSDVVQPAAKTDEDRTEVKKKTEQDHAQRRLRSALGSMRGNGFND